MSSPPLPPRPLFPPACSQNLCPTQIYDCAEINLQHIFLIKNNKYIFVIPAKLTGSLDL